VNGRWRRGVQAAVVASATLAAGTSFVAAQTSAEIPAPAGRSLQPIPLPAGDDLEPAVAAQLRAEGERVRALAAGARVGARDLADAYGALGQVLHVYEFFEPAELSYANAIRLAPGEARWPHLLGYLYQQTGRLNDAVEQFMNARRTQPDDRAATVRLGDVYLGLNQLGDARREFEQVLEVFPALAQKGLGEVAIRERRFGDAARHFDLALQRVPTATSLHYSLAMAYRGLGRAADARSHLETRGPGTIRVGDPIVDGLQSLVRGERGLVVLGRRAYEAGQYKEAAEAFAKAVDAAPASATPQVNLGLAHLQLGNTVEAARAFQAALRLDPANAVAHASWGRLLAREQKDAEAVVHLQAALEQSPDDASVARQLVGALVRLGRADDAIATLNRMRASDADDEDLLLGLVILLSDRQRFREALMLLDDANRRAPDRLPTATTLARLLASAPDRPLRDGRRALALATRIHASDPAAVHAETVAMALAELARCDEARTWITRAVTAAQAAGDSSEVSRLQAAAPQYEGAMCRP
jgi:tetratricopeptide (TPR) repeat protein